MGRMVEKVVRNDHFEVVYQCSCGMSGSTVTFYREEQVSCEACGQRYQLRVMIGRAAESGSFKGKKYGAEV